jgi:hypothetical protein
MGVAKFSVSFDPDLGDAIRRAAEEEDETVSAWLADAARQRIRNLLLRQFLDELMEEKGWTEEQLLAAAAEARARSFWVGPSGPEDKAEVS